jgi:Fur family transcriptional regulator, zinc uptake regulator
MSIAPPLSPAGRSLIASAEAACAAAGESFTPLRRRVLELLVAEAQPTKAYHLLDRLKSEHEAAKPPTIYRALDFLVRLGLVHRIESMNAFIACPGHTGHAPAVFLICRRCGAAQEAPAGHALHDLETEAAKTGFRIEHTVIEVTGTCAACGAAP